MGELAPFKSENDPSEGLTCIHARIHCAATHDGVEAESEVDRMTIDNFLETLSEVALAVAARESDSENKDERD